MDSPLNISSCNLHRYNHWQTLAVLWAPVYGFPVYAAAIFLLKYHSNSQSKYVRAAQLTAVILNYLELTDMSTFFFPQFILPVLGIQVGGVLKTIYPRAITYLIAALVIHNCINTTTLFIAHCRLKVLSRSIMLKKHSTNILIKRAHQLACFNYILMVISISSIPILFHLDIYEYQYTWKTNLYSKYHVNFIWCPTFFVLDLAAWEFIVMLIISGSITIIFAIVFVLCSVATILIVQSAKDAMSVQTAKYHMHVVTAFLVSCAIQAFFVVLPVFHVLLCIYSDFFRVYTGGWLFYSLFTQAHQGTAFTLFFAVTHTKTKKILKKFIRAAQKARANRIFKQST